MPKLAVYIPYLFQVQLCRNNNVSRETPDLTQTLNSKIKSEKFQYANYQKFMTLPLIIC